LQEMWRNSFAVLLHSFTNKRLHCLFRQSDLHLNSTFICGVPFCMSIKWYFLTICM